MSKHTPGPWERRVDETGSVFRIEPSAARGRTIIGYVTPWSMKAIARGDYHSDGGTAFANAALIAAAPEMYEALKNIHEWLMSVWAPEDMESETINQEFKKAYLATHAAIAKAEGRS